MDNEKKEFLDPKKIQAHLGIQSGAKVADFGCGSGEFSLRAASIVGESGIVYAVDVREEALNDIKTKVQAADLENVEIVRANLEVLGSTGFADDSIDVVLVINILFQSKKPGNVIDEARRVLKPRGRLVIIDWHKGAKGFGPPDENRHDQEAIKGEAISKGFETVDEFEAGDFHYGLAFVKSN
ncbi:MAG: methyltransferase domain-containing protein [Parcubacteria group bacterium]